MAYVVLSQTFEMIMGCVILLNVACIVFEANTDATCYPEFAANYRECPRRSGAIGWLNVLNVCLLAIYSVECLVRVYVERWAYFCNRQVWAWYDMPDRETGASEPILASNLLLYRWNMIDYTTVILGWVSLLLATTANSVINLGLFRLLRLVRVVRAIRILVAVPEFYLLVTGLYSAIKAIFFGSLMLVLVIIFWAVVAVEMFHPVLSSLPASTCEKCQESFSDVFCCSSHSVPTDPCHMSNALITVSSSNQHCSTTMWEFSKINQGHLVWTQDNRFSHIRNPNRHASGEIGSPILGNSHFLRTQ